MADLSRSSRSQDASTSSTTTDLREGCRQRVPVSGRKKLGIKVLGFEPWSEKATDYTAIAQKIKDSGAQSVYLGGIVCNNGVKLLKDLRSVVGPKLGVRRPRRLDAGVGDARRGLGGAGLLHHLRGPAAQTLGPTGKKFIAGLTTYAKVKGQMPPYPIYQGQSAQVMLDAIARSNGTRSSVSDQLFKTNVKNGIMGTFHFDKNGDIVPIKYDHHRAAQGERRRLRGRRHHQGRRRSTDPHRTQVSERGRAFGPFPASCRRP